jgi:hypothetical protein
MMDKYLLYRITSKLNDKPRLEGFSKWDCLQNLIRVFPEYKVICVADNCDDTIFKQLEDQHFYKLTRTSLGNSKSFQYLLHCELNLLGENDLVYFVEDDYLHKEGSSAAIEEGVQYFDYITLYDHPDKYGVNRPNLNPFVPKGPLSELTQVIKGKHCLWRTTNSTTMTFACFVRTIRQDLGVWSFFTKHFDIPRDFHIWVMLTCPRPHFSKNPVTIKLAQIIGNVSALFRRNRTLGVSIPSMSAHLELGVLPDNFQSDFLK